MKFCPGDIHFNHNFFFFFAQLFKKLILLDLLHLNLNIAFLFVRKQFPNVRPPSLFADGNTEACSNQRMGSTPTELIISIVIDYR